MSSAILTNGARPGLLSLDRKPLVFGFLWLLTFAIYLPAAKAGWVLDSAGWLWNVRHYKFWDYVNNTQSGIPSLYQFTQIVTYIIYKIFNANPYAWHTLMVTMHALNGFLFFLLCSKLFGDSGMRAGRQVAFAGVLLYLVCPHVSEVVVWEAAYHYLQGFLIILLILRLVQLYQLRQRAWYAWVAGVLFFCSTYSLEIFYLTPWFTFTLAWYYRHALGRDRALYRSTLRAFLLPQAIFFVAHLLVLTVVYRDLAHIGNNVWQPFTNYLCKAPRYIFHILFLGRFFSLEVRRAVYETVGSDAGLIVFYNVFVLICLHIVSRFRRMSSKGRACVLMFVWVMLATGILMPLAFPNMFIVVYDRYTYFLDAFTYMLLALGCSFIAARALKCIVFAAYIATLIFFTIKVNLLWKHSAYVNNRLLRELPDPGNKIVILLNIPQSINGIPMIGAESDGQFRMMRELFVGKLPNKIYDGAGYNTVSWKDGAHVMVANDSLVRVTLNQWGTWWWYNGFGGISYENEDYKLIMRDMGHWYDIILKHPMNQYLLLYNADDRWREVDIKRKVEEQY